MSHYRPKDGKDGLPGTHGKDGQQGERGDIGPMPDHDWVGTNLRFQDPNGEWGEFVDLEGKKGEKGDAGRDGSDGKDGAKGDRGPKGDKGEKGEAGGNGSRGPMGPMPDHQWRDTSLRFQEPDGDWGRYVNLKGEKGDQGFPGGSGGRGPKGDPGPQGEPGGPANLAAGDGITLETDSGGVSTISHGDTSSIADFATTFTGGVVMQQIALTYDEFGHAQTVGVLGTDLDNRYVQLDDQIRGVESVEIEQTTAGPEAHLVNDVANPEPMSTYSTNTSGVRGWNRPALFESTGLLDGGTLSVNAGDNTKFDVAAAMVGYTDYSTNAAAPTRSVTVFGPAAAVTVASLAVIATYVGIQTPGLTLVQQSSPFTATQRRSIVPLGAVISNGTNLIAVNNLPDVMRAGINQIQDLMAAIGPMRVSGNVVSPNGANLQINKSAGTVFKQGSNFALNEDDPHNLPLSGLTAASFNYRTSTGTQSASTSSINVTQYESPLGTLATVPNNRFTIQRISVFTSNLVRIQYGQHVFQTMAEAESQLATEAFVTEQNIAENGILLAFLIVEKNATSLNNAAQAKFIPASKFGGPVGTGGTSITNTDSLPEGVINLYFTDERAQDAVGNNLLDTVTINLAYSDATGQISADADPASVVLISGTQTITGLKRFDGRIGVYAANVSENADGLIGLGGTFLTSATNNVRGIRVDTDAPLGAGFGYCMFDAAGSSSGSNNIDHLIGFQSRPSHSGTGTLSRLQGFGSLPVVAAATTTVIGIEVFDCAGAGAVTNQYGLFVNSLAKGTNRYAVWVDGNNPSVFSNVWPRTNNGHNLGDASLRWATVYGVNGDFTGGINSGSPILISGANPAFLRTQSTGGLIMTFSSNDGLGVGFVGTSSNHDVALFRNSGLVAQIDSALSFKAGVDNVQNLGTSAIRWKEVFAGTGVINTSDAREKTEVSPLSEVELSAACQLAREIGSYRFLSSVSQKGDQARIHIGMASQRAIQVMEEHGLDPMRYGFICYDEWEQSIRPAEVDENQVVVREAEVIPSGNRYGFRLDQLLLFIARGHEQRLASLESRM